MEDALLVECADRTDLMIGLSQTNLAVHEWVGLLAYRLTGKIDQLFPAPKPTRSSENHGD